MLLCRPSFPASLARRACSRPPRGPHPPPGAQWLLYDKAADKLVVGTTANQDPASTLGLAPVMGVDVWEHAYYLQYKNVRPDYLKAVWQASSAVTGRFPCSGTSAAP